MLNEKYIQPCFCPLSLQKLLSNSFVANEFVHELLLVRGGFGDDPGESDDVEGVLNVNKSYDVKFNCYSLSISK